MKKTRYNLYINSKNLYFIARNITKERTELSTKGKLYVLIASIFLTTLLLLIALYGVLATLILLAFCAFCAGLGISGRSGYTAKRRKRSWTRKDGTVCYARKESWDVRAEELPDWVLPLLFLTVYFLITIPILVIQFIVL